MVFVWRVQGRRFCYGSYAISNQLNETPVLVCASLGGFAGLIAEGELRPGTFTSLTLVDIAAKMEPVGVAEIVNFMKTYLTDEFASADEAADVIGGYLPDRARRKGSENLDRYLRQCDDGRFRWHWDPRFITSVTNDDSNSFQDRLSDATKRLKLPVHLIRGGSNNLVTVDAARAFVRLAPHSAYTDIAGASHMVVGDRNDAFTEAGRAFLPREGDVRTR